MSKQVTVVTGANGYIASRIVENLLLRGVNVIGTVRSFNRAANLISKFPKEFKSGQLQFIEVDFTDVDSIAGIFNKYHNITSFIHPAQDFAYGASTPQDLDTKLIDYTKKSLDSIIDIVENSDSPIERFVYFSTSVAVRGPIVDYSKTFTEKDYASLTHEEALTNWISAYTYAKVAGEKTVVNHRSKKGIEYKVIVPPTVIGPPVTLWDDFDHLDSNNSHLYTVFQGKPPSRGVEWYADVRNIADGAALASDKNLTPGTTNNRYVIVDGTENYYDAIPVLLKHFKKYDPGNWEDLAKEGEQVNKDRKIAKRDLSVSDKELNHKEITFEQTVIDTVNLFLELQELQRS